MRAKHGADWWKGKKPKKAKSESVYESKMPVWTLTPTQDYEGMTYTKKVVATDEPKGPEFAGTAWAEPRRGFGRWPFDIYKEGASYVIDGVDFPENRGPHPTLKAALEAVQEDAFMTGT